MLALKDYEQAPYLVLATKDGLVKKTALTEYDTNRTGGLIAINLREGDELVSARLVDDAGKEVSVKLAWISPISGRRLLVDRRGLRQLVASPEQMAILAGEGRLVPNPAATPFEEAMRVVRRQLYAAAG